MCRELALFSFPQRLTQRTSVGNDASEFWYVDGRQVPSPVYFENDSSNPATADAIKWFWIFSLTSSQLTSTRVQLSVCSLCTDTSCSGEAGIGGGSTFLKLLQQALDSSHVKQIVQLQPTRCLMGCTDGCLVSIAQQGKMQYLLGRLPAQQDKADMVIEFTAMYANSITGIVPNHEWPDNLAVHFIGRIPPLEPNPEGDWSGEGCDL